MGYKPAHALRNVRRTVRHTVIAAATLAAASAGLTFAATSANATTLTCTNVQNALTAPLGCGGLQNANGTLDLAHASNVYNAYVTVATDGSSISEDWTAFAVNGKTTGGPGGLGEYVAMDTPDGIVPSFTVVSDPVNSSKDGETFTNAYPDPGTQFKAGPNTLCISVADQTGPNGKMRWWAVLRSCNTNGTFTYGKPATSETAAVTGSVTSGFANQWQVWAPVISSKGYVLVNTYLHNHDNVNRVLDITGNGGPGTAVQAYPENDQLNEEWGFLGCTPPASTLGGVVSPPYVNCP